MNSVRADDFIGQPIGSLRRSFCFAIKEGGIFFNHHRGAAPGSNKLTSDINRHIM